MERLLRQGPARARGRAAYNGGVSSPYRLEPADRERLVERLEAALGSRPDIRFAVVFGSFLDAEAFRDLDLAIWTTAGASPRLDAELAAALSGEIGLPVDVRRINDAPVPFLFHVLRGRPVAVRDEQCLADLMERTAREYHDREPLLRLATEEAFRP